jgi:hypothetical protein
MIDKASSDKNPLQLERRTKVSDPDMIALAWQVSPAEDMLQKDLATTYRPVQS